MGEAAFFLEQQQPSFGFGGGELVILQRIQNI